MPAPHDDAADWGSALSRRNLERRAVGAPMAPPPPPPPPPPTTSEPPSRARTIPPTLRRLGGLRRARGMGRPSPVALVPPPPRARLAPVVRPSLSARTLQALEEPTTELSLVAVVFGDDTSPDWRLVVLREVAACLAAGGALPIVVDLELESPSLHEALGVPNDEGIADAAFFGASLSHLRRRPADADFDFVPAGAYVPDPRAVLASDRWEALRAEARRDGHALVAYVPAAAPGLEELARHADALLPLGAPSVEEGLRRRVPDLSRVLGREAPPPTPEPPRVVEERPRPPRPEPPAEPPGPPEAGEPIAARLLRALGIAGREAPAEEAPEDERVVEERAAPPRPVVPVLSDERERAIRAVAVVALAYYAYYVAWRWTSTLNPDALWFAVPVALAETWGLLAAGLLTLTTWRLRRREAPPAPPGRTVDVFVTTREEPLEIVRRTARSARDIRYPHRTFVLDDGRRDEVRAMAAELGVEYLRPEGGLHHALRHSDGELVLRLDADHAPLPHILDRLVGYFEDPCLAFVQTPQDVQGRDGYDAAADAETRRVREERRLFFSVVQPGKDHCGAALYCGSCAVIRRTALEEVGEVGEVAAGDGMEEVETSLRLHAAAWTSAYHPESLAYGLGAASAQALHVQELRRARGSMRLLRRLDPLTLPGLTAAQRASYFHSLSAPVGGVRKLVLYLTPVVFFLTGALPVRALDQGFLVRFVPYVVLAVLLGEVLSRGLGFTRVAERHAMANFWTHARAVGAYFAPDRQRAEEAPPGAGHVPSPQVLLMLLTALAVNWASFASARGWVDYQADGWGTLAFQLNFAWAIATFLLAAWMVRTSASFQHLRPDQRYTDRFPIEVRPGAGGSAEGPPEIALTEELDARGLSFRSIWRVEEGELLRLRLPLSTRTVEVDGRVVRRRPDPTGDLPIWVHDVEFVGPPLDALDAVEAHATHHAAPRREPGGGAGPGPLARALEWLRGLRGDPPRRVQLPTWVLIDRPPDGTPAEAHENVAFLEEISRDGARLVLDEPLPPGTRIVYRVPGSPLRGEGRVVFSRALDTPTGVRFAVGVRRDPRAPGDAGTGGGLHLPRPWREAGTAVGLALALGAGAPAAAAQVQVVPFGGMGVDTEDWTLLMLGVSVQPGTPGGQPVAALLGFRLTFPAGAEAESVLAFSPSVGLRHQWATGVVQATVGYLWVDRDDDVLGAAFGAPGGAEAGLTNGALAEYRGTGARTGQLLGTWNWADDSYWLRARGAQRVGALRDEPVRLGLELGAQGGRGEPEGHHFLQAGPFVQLTVVPGVELSAAVGVKTGGPDDATDRSEVFPYIEMELGYGR